MKAGETEVKIEEHGIKLDICTACGINCTGNGHDEAKLIELDRDSKRFSPTALNPFSSPSLLCSTTKQRVEKSENERQTIFTVHCCCYSVKHFAYNGVK